VDTTGAGDAFAAGFLCGMLAGWPLEHTARFASAVGASCVMAIGTVAGIPSLDRSKDADEAIAQIKSSLRESALAGTSAW
jgi:sugar/nucleoside kinase (ribokinase family)